MLNPTIYLVELSIVQIIEGLIGKEERVFVAEEFIYGYIARALLVCIY
jgi:hypothetical protein